MRSWVWRLSMLWVVIGAGGAGYALVCTLYGCTTSQCVNDEFLFPLYNGEPVVIADAGVLAAAAWVLLAVPLLLAGFVRLRGWRRRNRLRTAAWAGAWVAAFALMLLVAVVGAFGADDPGPGWGELELPIFAAWLALGAVMTSVLAERPARERDLPEASDRSTDRAARARPVAPETAAYDTAEVVGDPAGAPESGTPA
jgi:hypothetical protein